MKQDEIIEMANKTYGIDDGKPLHPSAIFHLEIFAKLVAAKERETCAKICVELPAALEEYGALNRAAAAILARGEA